METQLAIIGGFISVLLLINGFLSRKTLEKIMDLDLKLAVLITRHDATEERSKVNSKELDKVRIRLHNLEGSLKSSMNYINELENKGE